MIRSQNTHRLSPLAFVIRALPPLGAAVAACLIGIALGENIVTNDTYFALLIIELVGLIALVMFQRDARLNWIFLIAFAFLGGIVLVPLVAFSRPALGGVAVPVSLVTTLLILAGFIIFGYRFPLNLSFFALPLLVGMLILIVGWIVGLIVNFDRPTQFTWYAAEVMVFFFFALIISSRIAFHYTEHDGTVAAIDIFIGGINLFAGMLGVFAILAR